MRIISFSKDVQKICAYIELYSPAAFRFVAIDYNYSNNTLLQSRKFVGIVYKNLRAGIEPPGPIAS